MAPNILKAKIDILKLIKIRNLCYMKVSINGIKKMNHISENIFASHMSDNRITFERKDCQNPIVKL